MFLRELVSITQGMTTTGKGAGARPGDWSLNIVESGDIAADAFRFDALRTIDVEDNARTEKHLLRPYDVLVTARSQSVKVALVPPRVSRTVAASTLLVLRPKMPEAGLGAYVWYFLTSRQGRAAAEARVAMGATIPSLSAAALGEVEVRVPPARVLHVLANFIEASEAAFAASVEAARLRRETLRDAVIQAMALDDVEEED